MSKELTSLYIKRNIILDVVDGLNYEDSKKVRIYEPTF